jgi:hypothetical protein
METKRKIEKIDKKIEKSKDADFNDLQDFYDEYIKIEKFINEVPSKFSGGLNQMRSALNSRTDSVVIAMILSIEKEGDIYYKDYREHRFDLALASYKKAKVLCEKIKAASIKKEQVNRLNKKIATTIETGESYVTSMVKNYASRALVFNVDDKTRLAKDSMKEAYKLLSGDMKSFVKNEAITAYNEMGVQLGIDRLELNNISKDNNIKNKQSANNDEKRRNAAAEKRKQAEEKRKEVEKERNEKKRAEIAKQREKKFIVNGNGTVTDLKTGLMWANQHLMRMTWEEAEPFVKDYRIGGYTDWRLPTRGELETLNNALNEIDNIIFITPTNYYFFTKDGDDKFSVCVGNCLSMNPYVNHAKHYVWPVRRRK